MKYLLICLLLLAGCGPGRPPIDNKPPVDPMGPETPVADPKKPGEKASEVEKAAYDYIRYQQAAAAAEAKYEATRKVAEEASLRAITSWITGICLLLAAACGVAAFFIPVGKKLLVTAALGLTTVAICAYAFSSLIPYIPWIAGAVVLAVIGFVIFKGRQLSDTVAVAADYGDRLEDWLKTDLAPNLDKDSVAKLNEVLGAAKEEAKKQATRLRVHGDLQAIRGKTKGLFARLAGK